MYTMNPTREYNTAINTSASDTVFSITGMHSSKTSSLKLTKEGDCVLDGMHIKRESCFAAMFGWMASGMLPDSEGFSIVFNENFEFRFEGANVFGMEMGSYFVGTPDTRQFITPLEFVEYLTRWAYICEQNIVK